MKFSTTLEERVMTALLEPKPNKREELLQTLHSLLVHARQEPGSLQALVTQSLAGGDQFLLYTVWQDEPSLAAYMGSDGFKVLLGAASTLSVPARFHFIADLSGHSAEVSNRIRDLGAADTARS